MTTPAQLLSRIVRLLDQLGIPYHVGGSVASSWYGHPRSTADLDVVIEADEARLHALAKALQPEYYVSPEAMSEALTQQRSFNAIALDGPFKIDFFIRGDRPFDREEFRRARPLQVESPERVTVRLKSPEDLILRKLEWLQLGGAVSDHQWRDVIGVLGAMRGRLDDGYMDRWAAELGLSTLLSRARQEAGSG
jgi:hypothetical protein